MRELPVLWRRIIGAALLALLLAGCSMVRLGYGQGPTLVYHWLDGYADFNGEQTPSVRDAIDQWFDWHRRTQLADYAALLARAQEQVVQPTITPRALCAVRDDVQRRAETALERAVPALASLMLSLTPEQLRHLERKMARDNAKLRAEVAPADRAERAKAALKRNVERYENLYGRLDDAQRARLAQWMNEVAFEPERWLAEREHRQRDMLRAIASVQERARAMDVAAARAMAEAAVRELAAQVWQSPRADYRAYQQRLIQDACAQAATMHNLMSAQQRQAAREKLKGWEDDLRILAGGTPANGNGKLARAD